MAPGRALVADIGGTNARFAIADLGTCALAHFAAFPCKQFPTPAAAIAAYLATTAERPTRAAFAVAGPVAGSAVL